MGAVFAALLGLAFGSFLNVCLTRLPVGESIAGPSSHCRDCDHALAWWENLPLLSWVLLRGRCHECRGWIGVRYPLVELALGVLWLGCWVRFGPGLFAAGDLPHQVAHSAVLLVSYAIFTWMLVALAALDAEFFWLPNWITLPGIVLGFVFSLLDYHFGYHFDQEKSLSSQALGCCLAILAGAGLVLFIRLAYWLVRRKEGMGLGDAKLMAMLGAWLGFVGAYETFALAILAASLGALLWLVVSSIRRKTEGWAQMPLPFGTFLCLTACFEVFYPGWLWNWYSRAFLP